jgi:DNA-directed RNA polymerase subunit M/transcription elongation factor TFIIS
MQSKCARRALEIAISFRFFTSALNNVDSPLTCSPTVSHCHCRNQLEKIPDDIITDPTLQRESTECPKCRHVGAVIFMAKVTPADNNLRLIYVCTNPRCVHKWQDAAT